MLQPHTPGKLELLPPPELAPDGNGGKHCLPPPVLAQSAIVEQPHLCGLPGGSLVQTGPSALVAQSASELHATPQSPVATSHTGPVALESSVLSDRITRKLLAKPLRRDLWSPRAVGSPSQTWTN